MGSWFERVMWSMAAAQAARLVWGAYQRRQLEPVAPKPVPDPDRDYPPVSVIVPARNEAQTITRCLEGLRAQRYPDLEIIVVDDRSEDGTGELVRRQAAQDPRLRLVEGAPLPAGWIGKCWALHQGAQVARGQWLLFVDADTRLEPGAVAGAVDAARERAVAVFSALTHQELPTIWERLVQPAVFGALAEALPISLVNDPEWPQFALANGQFLLVRRDAYEGIGGHAAVRAEIAEDAQFARRAKQLRWRYWLADGRALASTRMYRSPGALWEGWTKNLHTGMRLVPWLVPPGTALLVASLVLPYAGLALARRRRSPSLALAALVQLVAQLGVRRLTDRLLGVPPAYTLAQPLGQLAFLTLLAASFYKVLTGRGVTWKGRRYLAASLAPGALAPAC